MRKKIKKIFLVNVILFGISSIIFAFSWFRGALANPTPLPLTSSSGEFTDEWIASELTTDTYGYDSLVGNGGAVTLTRLKESTTSYPDMSTAVARGYLDTWFINGLMTAYRGAYGGNFTYTTETDTDQTISKINWIGAITSPPGWNGRGISYAGAAVTQWHVTGHTH